MQLIDRVGLIVRPKRRFVEWLGHHHGEQHFALDALRAAPAIYLVEPGEANPPDLNELIDRCAAEIFEDQLWASTRDESTWPINRSPHVFRDWFDVELADLVQDVDDSTPLVQEDEFSAVDAMSHCGWCLRELDEDEEPQPVTAVVVSDAPLQIPPGAAVPWFVPNVRGVALATAPDDTAPTASQPTLTFWVCSATCAAALRAGLEKQVASHGSVLDDVIDAVP